MSSKWQKLKELSWTERQVLGEAIVLQTLSALVLPWLGLNRSLGLHRFPFPVARVSDSSLLELNEIACRHAWFEPNCLSKAVALSWMLRRRGVRSYFRIGTRLNGGAIEAHAWVEMDGYPVNFDFLPDFTPFDSPLVEL